MRFERVSMLAVVFSFLTATAYADSLLAWEFVGTVTTTSRWPVLAEAYPVGTPFTLWGSSGIIALFLAVSFFLLATGLGVLGYRRRRH